MKSLTKSEITLEILKSFVYLDDFEISYASSPSGKPLGVGAKWCYAGLCETLCRKLARPKIERCAGNPCPIPTNNPSPDNGLARTTAGVTGIILKEKGMSVAVNSSQFFLHFSHESRGPTEALFSVRDFRGPVISLDFQ